MNRAIDARNAAKASAELIRRKLEIPEDVIPSIGLVLGTGWGEALPWDHPPASVPFDMIGPFKLDQLEGHARKVLFGTVGGVPLVALSGRIHLNEASGDPDIPRMVRLHVQMLFELGIRTLVVTAAVGGLVERAAVRSIVVIDGIVTEFAPDMPLFVGEFCSPEDTLDEGLRKLALDTLENTGFPPVAGGHVMVRGPYFEGRRYDKPFLRTTGASVVGMSILPELTIAGLYADPGKIDPSRKDGPWLVPARVLALGFVTNNDVEPHKHETNQDRARQKSTELGQFLKLLIPRLAAA